MMDKFSSVFGVILGIAIAAGAVYLWIGLFRIMFEGSLASWELYPEDALDRLQVWLFIWWAYILGNRLIHEAGWHGVGGGKKSWPPPILGGM